MANKNIPTIQTIRGNVGIGTTDPGAKLDVQGAVTIKGSGTGTSGSLAIQDDYSGGNHLGNIGWIRSSGGVYLSYGLKQENSAEWKSTYENFSGQRTYVKLDNNEFSMAHAPDQDTAVGTAVTDLTEKFKFYLNTGILQLNSYSAGILSTSSNGTIGLASSGDLPGGPYLPLAGGIITGHLEISGADLQFAADTAGDGFQMDYYNTKMYIGKKDGSSWHMIIQDNGNIGIGTTDPRGKLEVQGSAPFIYITDDTETESGIIFRDLQADMTQAAAIKFSSGDNKLRFYNNDTAAQRMVIDVSGRVGIGTDSPIAKLHIVSDDTTSSVIKTLVLGGGTSVDGNGQYIQFSSSSNDTLGSQIAGTRVGSGASSDLRFSTTSSTSVVSERMRIDKDGNVGIGTDSPGAKFHVEDGSVSYTGTYNGRTTAVFENGSSGGSTISIMSKNTGYSGIFFGDTTLETRGQLQFEHSSDSFKFINGGGSERMRIISNGNVGIGTTSPDLKLDVSAGYNNGIRIAGHETNTWMNISMRSYVTEAQANALLDHTHIFTTNPSGHTSTAFQRYGGTVIQCRNDGNTGFAIRMGNGTNWYVPFYINNNRTITCSSTVTATNFILSSDETLKENVKDLDVKVDAKWKSYKFKDSEETRYGVIAQELEETNPELVKTDDEGLKSVKYIDLLIAKIAELEARLEKLEN